MEEEILIDFGEFFFQLQILIRLTNLKVHIVFYPIELTISVFVLFISL